MKLTPTILCITIAIALSFMFYPERSVGETGAKATPLHVINGDKWYREFAQCVEELEVLDPVTVNTCESSTYSNARTCVANCQQ